ALAIGINVLRVAWIGIGGPCCLRSRWSLARRRAHPIEYMFVRDDHGAITGGAADHQATARFCSRLCKTFIATRMVCIAICINDDTSRFARKLATAGNYFLGDPPLPRVHNQSPALPDLNGDVPACAGQQVNIALNRKHLDFAFFAGAWNERRGGSI